jgi:hypothetical protein
MEAQPITISLHDDSVGYEITPERVPMSVLRSFTKDVEDFLRGDGSEWDVSNLEVAIFKGSLGIQTVPITHTGLMRDLRQMLVSEVLEGIDSKRREVVERWQKMAKGARHAVVKIATPALTTSVVINAQTDFHSDDADQWVKVERYMQGEVVEIGGLKKVNAHIRLQDGTLLLVESEREVFRNDKVNRLYKVAMARITAEYNVVTRKYRHARLLAFEEHHQTLDEARFQRMTERGAVAWKDVPKASEWVDMLRGGAA